MLSRFPFLFCWTKEIYAKSNLGGNAIVKQQACVLISQVNIHHW